VRLTSVCVSSSCVLMIFLVVDVLLLRASICWVPDQVRDHSCFALVV
jgi:hypothetical protein